jgi:3-isopropylmalate dehydrogenase
MNDPIHPVASGSRASAREDAPARHRIALLPGDGIGPEVVGEAVKILELLASRLEIEFAFDEFSVGAGEYLRSGDPLPQAAFEAIQDYDAILLGAMGMPSVRWPNGVEMTPQIDLRERLDLYCGLRPIYLYHADDSPLRNRKAGDIDLMLVRESTEGLFAARGEPRDANADVVEDRMRITRRGAERICRAAFEAALRRRRHVTLVDKANVLPSMAFFRQVFDEVAAGYPTVETGRVYVDAAALYLVQSPERFDVMVTENMFGDILSDQCAALVGGMGMAPSADIGDRFAVFQPSHGSAPDIAGKGIANPVATILSAAEMLDWIGGERLQLGASMIRAAVQTVFADPLSRTRDMGGTLSTTEMGDAIAAGLGSCGVAAMAGAPQGGEEKEQQ